MLRSHRKLWSSGSLSPRCISAVQTSVRVFVCVMMHTTNCVVINHYGGLIWHMSPADKSVLGLPDLCCVIWSVPTTSKIMRGRRDLAEQHNVVGVNCSTPAHIAAYIQQHIAIRKAEVRQPARDVGGGCQEVD